MTFRTAAAAFVAALTMAPVATAQAGGDLLLPPLPGEEMPDISTAQPTATPQPIQQAGYLIGRTVGLPAAPKGHLAPPVVPIQGYGPVIPNSVGRPTAPLYPSPVQYTPPHNGGTIITNQALAPHEMLYPHEYKAMYGPFYYKVRGGFFWTPFGIRTHEKWELQGTEVNVKYHDKIRLFSGYKPWH